MPEGNLSVFNSMIRCRDMWGYAKVCIGTFLIQQVQRAPSYFELGLSSKRGKEENISSQCFPLSRSRISVAMTSCSCSAAAFSLMLEDKVSWVPLLPVHSPRSMNEKQQQEGIGNSPSVFQLLPVKAAASSRPALPTHMYPS